MISTGVKLESVEKKVSENYQLMLASAFWSRIKSTWRGMVEGVATVLGAATALFSRFPDLVGTSWRTLVIGNQFAVIYMC
jgi:hypothetical protein